MSTVAVPVRLVAVKGHVRRQQIQRHQLDPGSKAIREIPLHIRCRPGRPAEPEEHIPESQSKKDLYLLELAEQCAREIPNFKFVPVLSEPDAGDAWTGRVGFVHRAVIEDLPDLSAYQVYACGAPVMVESAQRDFTQHHALPEDEFYADSFTSAADLANAV